MAFARTLKRSLILSFAAAAILPIIIISILILFDLTGDRASDIDEKNLLLAKAVSGQIEGFLREPQATLNSISGILQSQPDMPDEQAQALLDIIVAESDLFETIYILDRFGDVRHVGLSPERTGLRKDYQGINLSHMPFFQKTLATGEATWSDTFFSVISGEISIALTIPIPNGILVGNFSIRPLTEFVQKLHQSKNIIISVVDHSGTTIAHPNPALAAQQVHIGHLAPVKAALSGRETTLHYTFEQESYIGSSVLIPGPNWAVLVSQSSANAYLQVRNAGILFAAGAIGALLLSMLFSLSKASRLSKPLSELNARTDMIAAGQYDVSFHNSGFVEFDELVSNIRHMVSSIRDREHQLMKSRERYRQLVETMNDGLATIDRNGILTYVNPGLAKMLDYQAHEMIGRNTLDFLDDNNRDKAIENLAERKKGQNTPYELDWLRRDGVSITTLMSPKGLFEDGQHIGSFAVVSNISSRKKAEKLVKDSLRNAEESRDKLNAILRSVPLGLIVTNMQGRIIMMNRSAEKTLGQRLEDLKLQPIESALKEMAFQNHFASTITRQGKEEPIDLDLFDHDLGMIRTIQISSSLVQSQEEVQSGVITVLNDVTGERESDRLKSEFIATAAHELSTPLTAIMGYAELLMNQAELGPFPSEQLQEFYETIHDKSEALNRITEDLLHLSHMESGRTILLDKQPCRIEETIRSVVCQYRKESPERIFKLDFDGQASELHLDRGRIIQVLENLIGNAVKYSHPGGTVSIKGTCEGDRYRIDFIDDGIGMTPEQVERIFEKFYRANPLHTSISGLGMGMSIVKNIIDAHNGLIFIESERDKGTRVSISIPLG